MSDDYWHECVAVAAQDCSAALTPEQVDYIAGCVRVSHERYRQATGLDVADQNWRADRDNEQQRKGADDVLRYVEERVRRIDNGPATCFNYMSSEQRLAMHELFQARSFLRK